MIRAMIDFGINLVLAAIGILVAASTIAGVSVQWSGFLVAVLVFAALQAVLSPFVFNMARKYASAVLGGIGIVPGAVLGGLVLGIAETLGAGYISSAYEDVFAFGLLVLILILRPAGLLGKAVKQKV